MYPSDKAISLMAINNSAWASVMSNTPDALRKSVQAAGRSEWKARLPPRKLAPGIRDCDIGGIAGEELTKGSFVEAVGSMVEAAGVELITILITRNLLIPGSARRAKKAPLPDPLYVYCTKISFALETR
jgi:hypothetical protein